jgi:hypothetical protein
MMYDSQQYFYRPSTHKLRLNYSAMSLPIIRAIYLLNNLLQFNFKMGVGGGFGVSSFRRLETWISQFEIEIPV